METMEYTGTLVIVSCWCGLKHAIPNDLNRALDRRTIDHVCCPLGHQYISSDPNEVMELKAQVSNLRESRDLAWRSQAATKGHMTRLKKRVVAGVCPCCNKTFQDLAKHMKGQHPEYVK